ncbi:sulfated surface glycoprotein 185 [Phragmites australis]|uniref:sulfated surface glycoprotein 185 n=1 Tax=Phragmites australis TaxID=29695 RepID=UPI002D799397|nr:sulfated surface glycoprotein 185 [Phragmites australis]
MEFLVLFLVVSSSLVLPSLGLAVSGQEEHELVHLHEPSQAGVHVSVAHEELRMVASSVLGAESWLRTHVLAHYPSEHITTIVVGHGVTCNHGCELLSLRLSHAVKNLHHSLVRWGLVDDIKVTAASTMCVRDRGVLKRRLYGRHHLPPSLTFPPPQPPAGLTNLPPPPGVPLSFAPNYPPEVVPSVPPTSTVPVRSPVAVPASPPPAVSASPPSTMPSSPPTSTPASPPEAADGIAPLAMPPPCLAPQAAAMSPPPWSSEGGNGGGGLWCVAKPTVPEDKLQEAMDYACGQDGVDCQEIAAGGRCFYPDNIASHASYAFNSYWQKMRRIGGDCNFGGTAVLINSDPSYLQCRFMLG